MNPNEQGDLRRRLDKAQQQFRVLREIGLALESTMTFDEVLTMAVERMTHLMGAKRSTLFLVDAEGMLVSRVLEGDEVNEIALRPGQGIAGWVATHARPLIVNDTSKDERFDSAWDKKTGFVTRNILCHPILGRHGSVIGVAEVMNKEEGAFDPEDLELLGLLCSQLAMTVENSRMMIDLVAKNRAITSAKLDLERRNRELNLLLDLERLFARSEDVEELVAAVLAKVLDICNARVAVVFKMGPEGAESRVLIEGSSLRVMRVEPGEGFCGWVAAKATELVVDDPRSDPRFNVGLERRIGEDLSNLASVPVPLEEDRGVRGSLLVANKNGVDGPGVEAFSQADTMILRLVAAQLGVAMDNLMEREERERERRLATVGRLLAGVLHDLRSPITIISGYAEMMAARLNSEEGDEYLERVNAALDRISMMATEIIAFSKGERRVLPHSCLLQDLVDDFTQQTSKHLEANDVRLKIHMRTAGSVRLDSEKMLRAFTNIALNAVEAMPDGGTLVFEIDRINDELIFSFTDNGPGIPEEIQGSVFQSFVTLGKDHGTGLGLAVVREIVEAHGGKVNFTTMRGGGTTFLISVPV